MAEFLTTTKVSSKIEEIITQAASQLVLISPYWKPSKNLFERIQSAAGRNIQITLMYGKEKNRLNVFKPLSSIPNITLLYCDDLHAKCYFNESKLILTSMNIYEFSERNNKEMGIYIDRSEDEALFKSIMKEVEFFQSRSENVGLESGAVHRQVTKNSTGFTKFRSSGVDSGSCISCASPIPYNVAKPYCRSCYTQWSAHKNIHEIENVCHRCGKKEQSSIKSPECYDCYHNK